VISVAKAHAYGNDFLFVPAEQVGVIYYAIAPDGSAQMRLVNTDGSPSELSGNGLRCLAALVLHQREKAHAPPISDVRVSTDAGWKTLALAGRSRNQYTFRAAMGPPERIAEETLKVAGESLRVTTLAVGNPQCVALVSELPDEPRFYRLGPALATHPRFPQGTNVEFAVIEAPDRVRILIWERGVGPTLASGTGACASAVAAMAHGGASHDIDVVAPGGTQRVEWRDEGIYLTGWAEVVFDGQWISASDD
jgi:diaminopimelate epimerase